MVHITFLDAKEASVSLVTSDKYVSMMNDYERGIRMQKIDENNDFCCVNEKEFCDYLCTTAQDWNDDDKQYVTELFNKIKSYFDSYDHNLNFPNTVYFIKTNGLDDIRGANGYCRKDTIVLSGDSCDDSFFIHELFHIISQNTSHDKKFQLYSKYNFRECKHIDLPTDLLESKITNPDASYFDVVIDVEYQSQTVSSMPILFMNREDRFPKVSLLCVNEKDGVCTCIMNNDKPMIININDTNYRDLTFHEEYNIHPEEICASLFARLLEHKMNGFSYKEDTNVVNFEKYLSEIFTK
jgi:hypothetical protein